MKVWIWLPVAALLAGCNSLTMQSNNPPPAVAAAPEAPIYEPQVDMRRVKRAKYERDLAACREQAAPEEAAARQARKQKEVGTAMAVGGAFASFLPIRGRDGGHAIRAAGETAAVAGADAAAEGAAIQDQATMDYIAIVDGCLSRKRYRVVRA
jgi:hypothetical protein